MSELCDLDRDLMLSIDILPVPTDEAARQLQSTLLGVETNVANWQRRQNANNNFTATIPYVNAIGKSIAAITEVSTLMKRQWTSFCWKTTVFRVGTSTFPNDSMKHELRFVICWNIAVMEKSRTIIRRGLKICRGWSLFEL